jgi:thiopurine S-methyltransferase
MDPEFWHARWQENRIGFHLQETNPWLVRYWPPPRTAPGDRVLVPLCGKSLDMLWLLDQGYRVTGVEISRIAAEAFFAENSLVPAIDQAGEFIRYRCDALDILCGDFFTLDRDTAGDIDAVYDRASLIALPPAMRAAYARHLASLLEPGTSCLLITLDYNQRQMDGPPFAVTGEEITSLYADTFAIGQLCSEDVLDGNGRFRDAGVTRLHECIYRLQRK